MSEPLIEQLKADYPQFTLKNKQRVPKTLLLANGESIVVPEKGTVIVNAVDLNVFPDFSTFQFISPDMATLATYDVIQRVESAAPAKAPIAPSTTPSDDDTKPNAGGSTTK